jgi:CheY-like chemotaxis protein
MTARKPIPKPIHFPVNQPLETACSDAVSSHRDAPDGPGSPRAEAVAADRRQPEAAGGRISRKGRVLLLEGNVFFREAIGDCLKENGYKFAAVRDSDEGVRAVMNGDFTLVLYDPKMPGLPVETFYRSVGRIDPDLCKRFVFMSEDRLGADTTGFIKSVNGLVLKKPFDIKDLLESLALAELQYPLDSVFDRAAAEPVPLRGGETAAGGAQVPGPSVPGEKVPASLAHAETSGMTRTYALAALAFLLGLAATLWYRHETLRERLDAALEKRLALGTEWRAVSTDLQAAVATRSKTATAQGQLARISALRAKPHWAPVLCSIVPLGHAGIDILQVSARGEAEDLGACEVRVRGVAGGSSPRLTADRFRQSVEDDLKRSANGRAVETHFEELEDAPRASPGEKRADFVMMVTLGSMEPTPATPKEGR